MTDAKPGGHEHAHSPTAPSDCGSLDTGYGVTPAKKTAELDETFMEFAGYMTDANPGEQEHTRSPKGPEAAENGGSTPPELRNSGAYATQGHPAIDLVDNQESQQQMTQGYPATTMVEVDSKKNGESQQMTQAYPAPTRDFKENGGSQQMTPAQMTPRLLDELRVEPEQPRVLGSAQPDAGEQGEQEEAQRERHRRPARQGRA